MNHIVLIEDEPSHTLLLQYNLEKLGYLVSAYGGQEHLVAAWRQQPIDLIIISVQLDETNGIQVCQSIRDKGILAPILFLTTNPKIVECSCIYAVDYLIKPFSMKSLGEKVEQMIDNMRTPKEKSTMDKKMIYFLCTGNSCRSQIADGFLKAIGSEKYEVKSAGLESHGLNPRAVQVMKEVGVDISKHTSDVIDPEILNKTDYVITLCGHADEHCPVISNKNVVKWHWGFDDPAKATGTEEEIINQFREVRDAIKARVEAFVQTGN